MENKTKQEPIKSKFGAKTTAQEIADKYDLSGKNVIITGGYSGVGLEITKALAEAGAKLLVPVRNFSKAQAALKNIPNVEIDTLDLMNPESIDAFAERFLATGKPLHILINDAGIMAPPLKRDSRGYESQLSTNHLGHFQLTARLWPALVKSGDARVVAVSSRAQRLGGVNFDDPNYFKSEYVPMKAYAQSKTANVLFATELDRLGIAYGIRAFAAHPGLVPSTNLGSSALEGKAPGIGRSITKAAYSFIRNLPVNSLINTLKKFKPHHVGDEFKSMEQGAATPLWCAISDELNAMGGVYCEDCNIAFAVTDNTSPFGVLPWAIDPEKAARLWSLSEELTGVKFSPKTSSSI
ncbi:SDR family NAD(P)-dependent oxidoreductase [Desulfosporosinus sp. OT]|uniref:SDR family NAD(P)-dependent oxidoreductase n=1 Tax=Desulfosporosinus sp. OT TaxID=913865 RepID=UPI000223A3F1|nr:SDR family NAD(P)-dependent oxidoreductase [Desulfosporosinus sp. OT]EGW40606.1 short chain dehydrogenase family protein [Desulfosporosinus sp. OT]